MKRSYYIIFLLVIVLVAGGAFFFFKNQPLEMEKGGQEISPTTTTPMEEIDTSDWLTYRSEKFGYEIKYPKDASLVVDEGHRLGIGLEEYLEVPDTLRRERDVGRGFPLGVGLLILKKEQYIKGMKTDMTIEELDRLSIRDFMHEYIDTTQAPYPDFEKDITFAGMPAYYMEVYETGHSGLYQHINYSIYFFRNSNIFRILGSKLPTDASYVWEDNPHYNYFQKYIPISEKIIQTFKFIE